MKRFGIINNYQTILFAVKPFLWKEAGRQGRKERKGYYEKENDGTSAGRKYWLCGMRK